MLKTVEITILKNVASLLYMFESRSSLRKKLLAVINGITMCNALLPLCLFSDKIMTYNKNDKYLYMQFKACAGLKSSELAIH